MYTLSILAKINRSALYRSKTSRTFRPIKFFRPKTIPLSRGRNHRYTLLFLTFSYPPPPLLLPVATLVTVCRLDFLLNSTGKKLRIRERVTRSFPIYLSPGSSPAVVQTVHHRRHHRPSSPSTWQNSTQFPWNSRAPDRPRNSALRRSRPLSYERSSSSLFLSLLSPFVSRVLDPPF